MRACSVCDNFSLARKAVRSHTKHMKNPPTTSDVPTSMLPAFDPKQAWRDAAARNQMRKAEAGRVAEAQRLLAEIEGTP